jgi:peptidoglycan-associated lipoprotein
MKKLVFAGLTLALLAGCSSTPLNDADAPSDAKAGEPVDRTSDLGLDKLRSDSLLTQRSIYFDFDKFEVKPEYLDVVNVHV